MTLPSFSVVTPSYNQARYIRANIESVIAQNYPHVEHIIIDNASSDGTIEILESYTGVRWTSEPDNGQSDAVNKAIGQCCNEWIVWVNSDDFLLPGALEKLAEFIEQGPHISAIISNHIRVQGDDDLLIKIPPNYSVWKLRHWWWSALQLWQPGTIFNRRVFSDIGLLDVKLHYAMDFDLMLRAQDRYPFYYLDADLVAFRLHDEQKGHSNEIPFFEERMRSTLAYWRQKSNAAYYLYSAVLYFVFGSLVFVEGLRQVERGNRKGGQKLVWRGLKRNPLAVLRPEHLGFWLRKLFGSKFYYRHRN